MVSHALALIGPDLPWLAPLAGYSDLPFRLLCREYGASVCETEMVSAKGLIFQGRGTGRLLATSRQDSPLVVQLFGKEASYLQESVRILCQNGIRLFDLNMGCPVAKVMRQGAGAAMMGDLSNALDAACAMLKAARDFMRESGESVYMGFKMRLGIDDRSITFEDLACRLEDIGAHWITIHPRTAAQGYGGHARWEFIERVTRRLDIPVIASGDIFCADDALGCMASTGARGVMYARGALRNPAVFCEHKQLCASGTGVTPSLDRLQEMILRHVRLSREYGSGDRVFFKMRLVIPRYVRNLPGVKQLRLSLCSCACWSELTDLVEDFFSRVRTG